MRFAPILVLAALTGSQAFCQSAYAPLNDDYYHWVDRYEVKAGRIISPVFTAVKPYERSAIIAFMDSVENQGLIGSRTDRFNYDYLRNDSWEWSGAPSADSDQPVFRHFYRKKSDFFHVDHEDFDLHVNPVLYVGAGKDSRRDEPLFVNTRGVEVRGMVDRKVAFYTYLTDNQVLLPQYVSDWITEHKVVPHEGFWKNYKEGQGVDFLQARGYVAFYATKHIGFQFGHDRMFIGNGYRSLIFSDFAPPALFLKGNVKVWKLNYLFVVNQMVADNKLMTGTGSYPNKYNALHHLSINVGKKFNLGVFESVIFSPDDPTGASQFRLDYLNPIIFYRAIEQQNGSSDNVLLGMDFKWNVARKLSLYGQFILDEFVIDHLRDQDGWWANKFGVQVGGKYVDAFGIANLDFQGEVNVVRPYTYSHGTNFGNYSSYRQPIAHPLGANFREVVGIMRYQPLPRLNLTAKLMLMETGRDTTGVNWGGDILKLNTTRERELGNTLLQGVQNQVMLGTFTASWQLKHNVFIDGAVLIRKSESIDPARHNNTTITSLALRWNIPQRHYDF